MIHAYNKTYLEKARINLATMLDYAVNDCNIDIDTFWDLFIKSNISTLFETGDSSTIVGSSGIELAQSILNNNIDAHFRPNRTREYWTGWAIAYYQWYRNLSFSKISISLSTIRSLYNPYHEMDITQFCDKMDEFLKLNTTKSNLKRIREEIAISQSELATLTGIPLRTIQQYEQKQKDINGARGEYLVLLSKVLHCRPEDLLE